MFPVGRALFAAAGGAPLAPAVLSVGDYVRPTAKGGIMRITPLSKLICSTVLIALSVPAAAGTITQTDWSQGEGQVGPVTDPGARFESAAGVAWLSIPGQLSLSATPLGDCPEHLINDAYYESFGIATADIDRDGDMDVVGTAQASGIVSVWFNSGTQPVTWTEQVIDNGFAGADAIYVTDLDQDGWPDVLASASDPTNSLAWWRNDGASPIHWTRQIIDPAWPFCYEISTADVDGDGRDDLLAGSWDPGTIAWWRNNGGSPLSWTKYVVDGAFPGAHSAWGADLDGDLDTDIIGTGGLIDEVAFWRNDGGSPITWTKQVIRTGFTGGRSVHPADIDSDGDIDVVGACWTNELTWWRNEGGDPIVWTEQVIAPAFNGGHCVDVADIDGNGHLDVLGAACVNADITWFGNDGNDPITWSRHIVDGNYTSAIDARAGDIDGDGALEILGTSMYWGTFTWWEATQFIPSGELTSSILDLQEEPALALLSWTAEQPAQTGLGWRVRWSDDPTQMGAWSEEITEPGPLSSPTGRYFQYQLHLQSADPDRSPVVSEVELTWFDAGDAPAPPRTDAAVLRLSSPVHRAGSLHLDLEQPSWTELSIHDVHGRTEFRAPRRFLGSGHHELRLPELSGGVHFARLVCGGKAWDQRLVVLD